MENLGLSAETVAALHKRGIASLFPIQKSVFAPAMEGRDLIGRAKTGSGKTLAFALPVVEGLLTVGCMWCVNFHHRLCGSLLCATAC